MTDSVQKPLRLISWGIAIAILTLSLVPADLRPETGAPRLLEHSFIYVAFGVAFGLGYSRKQGLLVIFFLTFVAVVEAAQLFVPSRHARVSDFLVDAVGAYIGLLAALLAEPRFNRSPPGLVRIATLPTTLLVRKMDKDP